ncbi:MAG: DUF3500 domain-containing protein [Steroidobacter sp.]
MYRRSLFVAFTCVIAAGAFAQTDLLERFRSMSQQAESRGLAEPFKGVTTSGQSVRGLFPLRSTGVSTEPVRRSAERFLGSLDAGQRTRTAFGVDDDEWRKWMNQHFYVRQGVSFEEMIEPQRAAALDLLRASLSAKGLKLSRDIMKLNHTLGELNNDNFVEYGEWLYWITIMGEPSATEPWGWQLDGHHLIINYFVLGDQVVMTPLFVGSEPVTAESGKYKGTAILRQEQNDGLRMYAALTPEQQKAALIQVSKTANNNLGEAFKDNLILDYAGVAAKTFTGSQKKQLLDLIGLYIHNMKEDQARVRMEEVAAHLDETYFAWVGEADDDAVFYYRIHNPVVLIEFDHQSPANLRHLMKPGVPNRQHIHVVVRTPNGNDYGKDLLRQHYEKHSH